MKKKYIILSSVLVSLCFLNAASAMPMTATCEYVIPPNGGHYAHSKHPIKVVVAKGAQTAIIDFLTADISHMHLTCVSKENLECHKTFSANHSNGPQNIKFATFNWTHENEMSLILSVADSKGKVKEDFYDCESASNQ